MGTTWRPNRDEVTMVTILEKSQEDSHGFDPNKPRLIFRRDKSCA
jgi:hypothetical protein